MADHLSIPDILPVMVLPSCNLMPQGMLPLYIFEAKYREMLRDCLDGNRLFCVGMGVDAPSGVPPLGDVLPYSTAGLIRACVAQDDGTSQLVLQGAARIQILEWVDSPHPYRMARIDLLGPPPASQPKTITNAFSEIESKVEQLDLPEAAKERIRQINDIGQTIEILAATFVADPAEQQAFLAAQILEEQLTIVSRNLPHRPGHPA